MVLALEISIITFTFLFQHNMIYIPSLYNVQPLTNVFQINLMLLWKFKIAKRYLLLYNYHL